MVRQGALGRRPAVWLTGLFVAFGAALLLLPPLRSTTAAASAAVHAGVRRTAEEATLASLRSWPVLRTPHLAVHYEPGYAAAAAVAAGVAERAYGQVAADLALPASPQGWPVVVADAGVLCAQAGCPADGPPLGLYASGIVWLLAPTAFLRPGPDLAGRYAASGVAAHELTHLADDVASGGRVPVWLDEGIAQYEAWRLTGYVWMAPNSTFDRPLYSWRELTQDFTALPNQALAYRQALAVTADLCRTGPGDCLRVLEDLRGGDSVDAALAAVAGTDALSGWERGLAWRSGDEPVAGQPAGPPP